MEPGAYRQPREPQAQHTTRPTAEQKARSAKLRRFNRLTIYLPLGLVTLAWIALIVTLLWLSVAGAWFAMDTDQANYRQLFSAVADIVTILALAPLLLLCALPPVGAIGLVIYRRQRKVDTASAVPSLPLFWRIENFVIAVRDNIAAMLPRLAHPVISAHATAAFVNRFVMEIKQIIRQEISRNGDDR